MAHGARSWLRCCPAVGQQAHRWSSTGQTVTITRNRQGGVDTTVIPGPCAWIARGNQEACTACEESLSIRSPGGLPGAPASAAMAKTAMCAHGDGSPVGAEVIGELRAARRVVAEPRTGSDLTPSILWRG
jgi:hypothetical protein